MDGIPAKNDDIKKFLHFSKDNNKIPKFSKKIYPLANQVSFMTAVHSLLTIVSIRCNKPWHHLAHTCDIRSSKLCWVWGVHCRRMAKISGTVVVESVNSSLQCGQLGSKKVNSSLRHSSHSGGSTAVCTVALSRWGGGVAKSTASNDPAVILAPAVRGRGGGVKLRLIP